MLGTFFFQKLQKQDKVLEGLKNKNVNLQKDAFRYAEEKKKLEIQTQKLRKEMESVTKV